MELSLRLLVRCPRYRCLPSFHFLSDLEKAATFGLSVASFHFLSDLEKAATFGLSVLGETVFLIRAMLCGSEC